MPPPPPKFVYKPHRPPQRATTDPPNPPPNFDHKPRVLVRRDSRSRGGGQQKDGGGGKRSWYRSNSTPPDTRNHHDRGPPQDGGISFAPVSANDSRTWGVNWAKTFWEPGRVQTTQVHAQVQVNGRPWCGQLQDAPRGRTRRSSDARHPNPVLHPTPRPAQSTPPSRSHTPVIPGVSPSREMGLGKLFRRNPQDHKKILFYDKSRPHYGFTNFSPHPVEYLGRRYPTSEHLFQALKFTHKPNLMEHIRTCDPRPSVALAEARRFSREVRPDWKRENIRAMETVLFFKFTQHKKLKRELLRTGDAELVEDSHTDSFWGCGADGLGRNELGKALMRLRRQIREQEG